MTLNLNPNSLEDMTMVSPSLLSADFANLQRDIEMLNQSECDWFHLDVMDGVFVPNISFGFPVMQAMARHAEKPLDVHLMIVQPEKFIPEVKALGARVMNVHYEACTHLHRVVQAIKAEGMLAGVTLNPHTPVSVLEEIAPDLDFVRRESAQTPCAPRPHRLQSAHRSGRWGQSRYRPLAGRCRGRCAGGGKCGVQCP